MNHSKMPVPNKLDVTLYGNSQNLTPTLSKCRARIFYKGMNRNHTYISDDFANQLITSLPYTPIKGIFSKEDVDYTDHGDDNTEGRIYGIVPENPNFAWETFEDNDGTERSYACSDVLLFTGLYPEAKLIPGESQSMEIFRDNLKGEWRISEEDGDPYYYFMQGCLVGLQVLGNGTEPCFEGASFFSKNQLSEIIKYVKNEEGKEMSKESKTLFRLSDSEKACKIDALANPNFNEEGNWVQDRIILNVYDDYAVCGNFNSGKMERVYYTKDGDEIVLGDIVEIQMVDVTADEYAALESLKQSGGGLYAGAVDKIEQLETEKEALSSEKETLSSEKEELSSEKEVLISEKEALVSQKEALVSQNESLVSEQTTYQNQISEMEQKNAEVCAEYEKKISSLQIENSQLSSFKANVEKQQKQAIIDKYEEYLTETAINNFKESMDKYSVNDFKKEVCTAAVELQGNSIFSKKGNEPAIFYKSNSESNDRDAQNPAIRLLNNYKNGGNK